MTAPAPREPSSAAFARYGLAACAIVFPLLLIAWSLSVPSELFSATDTIEEVQAFADNPDWYGIAGWLWPISVLVGVPALLAVGRVARASAPALGLAGLVLAFGVAIPVGINLEALNYAGIQAGLDASTNAALQEAALDLPATLLYEVGVLFGLIGHILLGIAILRARLAPRWVGIFLIVGAVANPVGWMSGSPQLLALCWLIIGIGYGGCALMLLRQPVPAAVEPATSG